MAQFQQMSLIIVRNWSAKHFHMIEVYKDEEMKKQLYSVKADSILTNIQYTHYSLIVLRHKQERSA